MPPEEFHQLGNNNIGQPDRAGEVSPLFHELAGCPGTHHQVHLWQISQQLVNIPGRKGIISLGQDDNITAHLIQPVAKFFSIQFYPGRAGYHIHVKRTHLAGNAIIVGNQ